MVTVNAEAEVARLVAEDKRLRGTEAPWRRCMKERGHAYRTPEAARTAATAIREKAEKSARGGGSKAATEDGATAAATVTAIAVDDARCDRRVGRAELVRALDRRYRDRVARARSREITTYRTARARGLAALGAGSPSD